MSKAKNDIARQIEQLRDEIRHHDELYYQQAKPEISDQQYDKLMQDLITLESENPELITPDSPTHRVGGKPLEGFESYNHVVPMMSIDNTYDEAEVRSFDQRVRKALDGQSFSYTCEPKIDGLSLSLRYENGVLAVAATRGNGRTGDNVTVNAKTIQNIPLRLKASKEKNPLFGGDMPAVIEVRGEVYLSRKQFLKINRQQEEMGLEQYANPRNTAAGTLKLLDSKLVAARKLSFLPHGAGAIEGLDVETYEQWQKELSRFGFVTNEHFKCVKTIDDVIEYLHDFAQKRPSLAYDTDGVVIKINSFKQREDLGTHSKAPKWCIAYKYQPEQAETELARVVFQVGKTGTITPVAEFEPPVFISGTNVYRASLHNFDEIERKDIHLHDKVLVEKAGEVIPYVVGVVENKRPKNAEKIERPTECPSCGSKDLLHDGGFVRCQNPSCPAQLKERMAYFCGRNQMDIADVGPALIDQLLEKKLIASLPDLYRLKQEQLEELERMGEKSAANVVKGIRDSKERGLSRLLAGLGILHVGNRTAQIIAEHFGTYDKLAQATLEQIDDIPGMGEVVAKSLHDFLQSDVGQKTFAEFKELGLKLDEPQPERAENQPFAGMTIVVTGTLQKFSRSEIKKEIERLGGKTSESVSKKTSFVLAGDDAGSKLDKAKSLNVEVIDEAEFIKRAK